MRRIADASSNGVRYMDDLYDTRAIMMVPTGVWDFCWTKVIFAGVIIRAYLFVGNTERQNESRIEFD